MVEIAASILTVKDEGKLNAEGRKQAESESRKKDFERYTDWLTSLDHAVENRSITTDERNSVTARALMARDRAAERYKGHARIDSKTRLPNNRALEERYHEAVQQVENGGEPFGFLIVDLDHFKEVNDTHGHPAGDSVLFQVGLTMAGSLRQLRDEEQTNDLVARYGGEEFAIVLPGVRNEEDLKKIAEKLRTTIGGNPLSVSVAGKRRDIPITASFGGGIFRKGEKPKGFFERVDKEGLYRAKETGRNRSVIIGGKHG